MTTATIKVLIADDHLVVRQGLRSLLATVGDVEIVGEAEDGAAAVHLASALKPDILLLDMRMPGLSGIEVISDLRAAHSPAKIIVLTTYDDDDYLFGALEAGVEGYLLKNLSQAELAEAIRAVSRGERVLAPALTGKLLSQFTSLARERARGAPPRDKAEAELTEAEIQLLQLMADGASNKLIAEQMYWSEVTVKRRIREIFAKLGASHRAQAVAEAFRRGKLRQ